MKDVCSACQIRGISYCGRQNTRLANCPVLGTKTGRLMRRPLSNTRRSAVASETAPQDLGRRLWLQPPLPSLPPLPEGDPGPEQPPAVPPRRLHRARGAD